MRLPMVQMSKDTSSGLLWTSSLGPNGYEKRYGLFYVDFETQERYPKKSAHWYIQGSSRKSSD